MAPHGDGEGDRGDHDTDAQAPRYRPGCSYLCPRGDAWSVATAAEQIGQRGEPAALTVWLLVPAAPVLVILVVVPIVRVRDAGGGAVVGFVPIVDILGRASGRHSASRVGWFCAPVLGALTAGIAGLASPAELATDPAARSRHTWPGTGSSPSTYSYR